MEWVTDRHGRAHTVRYAGGPIGRTDCFRPFKATTRTTPDPGGPECQACEAQRHRDIDARAELLRAKELLGRC